MGKNGKQTPAEAEAGCQNLLSWKADHPGEANLKHGAYSNGVRRRYGDKRFREGKQLDAIMKALVEDCGGQDKLTASQRLILDSIKSKIVVLFQISKYVDLQPCIIDKEGNLLPCLGRGFTTYSEALRRDLEALTAMGNGRKKASYKDIMKRLQEGEQP